MSSKQNYLDFIPVTAPQLKWSCDSEGIVTLEKENEGLFNRIAQFIFKKPKISYIHLDELGSFVWQQIDGERDITAIGVLVKEHFGEKCEPLYEKLSQYFKILDSYEFIAIQNGGKTDGQ